MRATAYLSRIDFFCCTPASHLPYCVHLLPCLFRSFSLNKNGGRVRRRCRYRPGNHLLVRVVLLGRVSRLTIPSCVGVWQNDRVEIIANDRKYKMRL